MKNTGKGETSTIEQSKVDEPVEITNRNDINRLEKMAEGQKLKIVTIETPLYEDKYGYFQPKHQNGSLINEIKLKKGDIVTYKGKYEKYENKISQEVTVYIEVKMEDGTEGYLKLSSVSAMSTEANTKGQIEKSVSKIASVTSRAGKDEKIIGQEGEKYVVAIAAGRNSNNGIVNEEKNLVEEELTIKVSEKVEKMLGEYSNIKVVQTGSTSDNPDGVEPENRAEKTRNANPNLCIQIYFRDGDNPGVETIYKQGDDISQQLAEILSNNLALSMGLNNLNAGEDTDKCKDAEGNSAGLSIIENAAITGFPSVVALGGNLNKDPDATIIASDGVDKYAQAIVKSIDEYFKADRSGRVAVENEKTTYKDSVESKIINMKYVSQEKLQEYVDNNDFDNALKSYTIDENRNLVIVSWTKNEDGKIELKTNNSMSLKTALSKYTMPYEYLLYFYIDTDYRDFVDDLADEVINNSELVVAVQDNITTTDTTEIIEERTDASVDSFDTSWAQTSSVNKQTESVSTSVNLTYVSTWCVKAYQENSYSKAVLELGDNDEKIVTVPGKVTESNTTSQSADETVEGGPIINKYTVEEKNSEGKIEKVEKTYSYNILKHTITKTHTISNSYENGEYKTEGRENVFIELYNKHHMSSRVRTAGYLFTIIENNQKTANLLNLTKYLIYKATNVPWGVLEFNYDGEYSLSSFSSISGIYGGTIQEKVWFAVLDAGYSKEAAAGVLGNIEAESGFDQSLIEGGSGIGYGLCQWSYGRRTQLEAYAQSKGKEPSDVDTQIEFLIAEITPGGGANGYANYQLVTYNGYSADSWKNASSPEDAAIAFCWSFERPGIPRMSVRTEAARKYYDELKDKEKGSADARVGVIKLSGENAKKMTQLLDEAIRIADDDRYTYSQANRYGEFQYDCSSLVARLYKQFFNFTAPSNTRGYGSEYYVGNPDSIELQPGDVVWKPGHVELYIGNGMTVGAHTDECAGPDQISVVNYPKGYYTKAYRFINN